VLDCERGVSGHQPELELGRKPIRVQPVAVYRGIPPLTTQPPSLRNCVRCSCASASPISGLLASLCPHSDTEVCLLAPAIGQPECHSASAPTAQGSHSEPQRGSLVLFEGLLIRRAPQNADISGISLAKDFTEDHEPDCVLVPTPCSVYCECRSSTMKRILREGLEG
jgi:hypothetical protein